MLIPACLKGLAAAAANREHARFGATTGVRVERAADGTPRAIATARRILRRDPLHPARARAEVFPTREAAEDAAARWLKTSWGKDGTAKVVPTWVKVEASTEDMT